MCSKRGRLRLRMRSVYDGFWFFLLEYSARPFSRRYVGGNASGASCAHSAAQRRGVTVGPVARSPAAP